MCSALPGAGGWLSLRVSFVEVHPAGPLVRLWGTCGEQRRREEYARLAQELQAKAGPRLSALSPPLALAELCLVERGGRWLRARVVGCPGGSGEDYRVFLLDEGRTVGAEARCLAHGPEELFRLPSEVLGCVVADLVPAGFPGSGLCWSPAARDFLSRLQGQEAVGLVREVLLPEGLVVLELPWLLAQMQPYGLASLLAPGAFRALLQASLAPPAPPALPSAAPPAPPPAPAPPAPAPSQSPEPANYFYPRLELDVTEPVIITQISDPHRVYCQLRSFSKEIQVLSEGMCQAFRDSHQEEPLPKPGSTCAARGIDGCWYRALLLETYLGTKKRPEAAAQVICVDYGRKEFVTQRNLRRLPAEYFRMPVMTYPCSLQGITDRGAGWSLSQISELKMLLLGKVVQARIEAYCPFEHLYYVTLYREDGLNLNCLFGVQAHCLAQSLLHSTQEYTSDLMTELKSVSTPGQIEKPGSLLGMLSTLTADPLPVVHLKAGEHHSVQVTFLRDPTEFCVHLQEHRQPLCRLKQNLNDFYSQTKKLEGILLEPKPGSLCCVMLKENSYHRALVTRVEGKGIEVYLVDKGNSEIVDLYKVKELLSQFRELPAVALRCTLANPSPGQAWSLNAVDYFRKAVLNKKLVIKVLGMQGTIYEVELFDHALKGEKNLGKIMSQGLYTKHHENVQVEKDRKMIDWPLLGGSQGESILHQSDKGTCYLYHREIAEKDSNVFPNPSAYNLQNYSEITPGLYCEEQLKVGSTVNVVVSYTESPSLFWCQLAKNTHDLKALMAKIQDYCIHAVQPLDWPIPVCLAKFSEDNKWYRALIISKVNSAEEVEVVYVDFGNKEHVSLKDVRATKEEFMKMKAQAFRCSLYNLIQPKSPDPFVWSEEANEAFQEFLDSAKKTELKCTIFALASLNSTDLFNIVDLITPFESFCHFLTRKGLARSVHPQNPLIPSVHLISYYHSTHDIKIGSEEKVYVTHVKDPCFFYCQLARSADVLEQLTKSISKLSKTWHSLQTSQAPGSVYLAKFTDGCWYRAVVISSKTNKEVFFVDYGNTQLLKNEDLIVVPNEAFEILLLPMQAIKCCLSDIPAEVSKDAAEWFEKSVQNKPLKALIVAKEHDGKLIVELYDGKIKINSKLKEVMGLRSSQGIFHYVENQALSKNSPKREIQTEKRPSLISTVKPVSEIKRSCTGSKEILDNTKHGSWNKEGRQVQLKTEKMTRFPELVERIDKNDNVATTKDSSCVPLKTEKPSDKNRCQIKTKMCSSFKSICDLSQKTIKPGLKTSVYISHINHPSDFYVQLVEDEPMINSISEKLNNSGRSESLTGEQLHIGDLLCAMFSEDGLWYRAVVNEKPSGELVTVRFIDYGNTAVISICKTRRLLGECSSFPAMSIHCSLGGVKTPHHVEWTQEAILNFSERVHEIQMNSEFVEKCEGKWEIILSDEKGNITVDLIRGYLTNQKPLLEETLDKTENEINLINLDGVVSDEHSKSSYVSEPRFFHWTIPKIGQTLSTFSIIAKGPDYFWCRFTEIGNTDSVERELQRAGELEGMCVDYIKRGCPCLVKCSKDDTFYRAVVSNFEENTLTVIRIDYGIEECVNTEMIRHISAELLAMPPQAFLCRLFGFSAENGSWTEGVNKFFCDKVADFPLEVIVVDKRPHCFLEIPVFIVKLECRNISINEQMKSFWKYNSEDSGSTLTNIHSPKNQVKDTEDNSNTVIFEKETFCSLVTPLTTGDLEDLLSYSELLKPGSPSSVDEGSRILVERISLTSPSNQTRHDYTAIEQSSSDDSEDLLDFISLSPNDNTQMPKIEVLGVPSFDSTVGLQAADSPSLDDKPQQRLKLDLLEVPPVEEELEQHSLSNTLLDEQVETSSCNIKKEENTSNLKGFDIGSKCMILSGTQWYKAKILDISLGGIKVLNLSTGKEEIVSTLELDPNATEEEEATSLNESSSLCDICTENTSA
ncbi:tudor domain-containing protein 6 [Anolis carolinensis]|uniref:tudor domain-containing protein 6 n=1 Tax=Anolis carolinensis TaxID=28377 RepID=UPI002F2B69E7